MATKTLNSTLACLTLAAVASTQAAPVVAVGSSYQANVWGLASGMTQMTGLTFDGVAESRTSGGTTVTINESQQDLGGGAHRVSFVYTSDVDMFPSAGETGVVNIGYVSNPLDLLESVDLINGIVRMYDAAGGLLFGPGTFNNPLVVPWDGYWIDSNTFGGFGSVGGRNIRRIELDINVAVIPEPHSVALVLMALVAGVSMSRRKSGQRPDLA